MKNLIVILLTAFVLSTGAQAQTYYKLNEKKAPVAVNLKGLKMKTATGPAVSVKFLPISYTQINLQASYIALQYKDGAFSETGFTVGFTPSYVRGGAMAKITVTNDRDTLYELSSNLYYGAGLTGTINPITGKLGVGPGLVGGIDSYAVLVGYDLVNSTAVLGASFSINNIPWVNNKTKITLRQ